MYISIKINIPPQFCSSDISPQSFSPSQTQDPLIQRPVLAHWNWSSRHAVQSPSKQSQSNLIQKICGLGLLGTHHHILQNSSVTSVTLLGFVCDATFLWRHSSSSRMTKAIQCRQYFAASAAVTSQTSRHGAERRDGLYNFKDTAVC